MKASGLAARLAATQAQVHTDSLTVLLDLQRVGRPVADALRTVLQLPASPGGLQLPAQTFESFQRRARGGFERLAHDSPLDALEFATLVSAFLHECRHVHDMRATRVGAELLLADLPVYAGSSTLIDRLTEWHAANRGRHVSLPLTAGLGAFGAGFNDIAAQAQRSADRRSRVARWWGARSRGRTVPGHSIHALFEALGFAVQAEWLAATFGPEVASTIVDTVFEDDVVAHRYVRPVTVLASLCAQRGVAFDPELHDLSWLLVYALNVSGLREAFAEDGTPTPRHPGSWFDEFAVKYAALAARPDLARELVAPYAVELATQQAGIGGMSERFQVANAAIQEEQDNTLRQLVEGGLRQSEPLLIATEVAIDFRHMHGVLAEHPEYHQPLGYVEMLVSGVLTRVYVRIAGADGHVGDFTTASDIPANHVGAMLAASEASQQMRLLLDGRAFPDATFLEDDVHRRLTSPPPDGRGLSVRVRRTP